MQNLFIGLNSMYMLSQCLALSTDREDNFLFVFCIMIEIDEPSIHSLMKALFVTLTVLALTGNIQQSSSAPLSYEDSISLYNATDKLTVLTSQNFSSTIYQSKTAWLIEFYASWCGHCRTYANTYRAVAINAWTWQTVVRIGAMNCNGGENANTCRQHGVQGYPTIRLFPPGAVFDNTSKAIIIPTEDAKDVTKELIKELDNMHRKYKTWPRFTPANRVIFEELYAHSPSTIKLLFLVAEKRDDSTGRQLMLDFSEYREQISIFRTTTDGRLWRRLNINITDVPALFVILRNRTAERIDVKQNMSGDVDNRTLFHNAIRSYIHKTKSIDKFNDRNYEEMIRSRNALKAEEIKQQVIQKQNIIEDNIDKNTIHRKVNMIDLELALSHMFRQEIPQMKQIQGQAYKALVQWLTILIKYFPGREPVLTYLKQLLSKVNEHPDGFTGDTFQQLMDIKTSNAYLPNHHNQYQHCAGSEPQYRGYPCALWLLFHTLTVSQYQQESQQINILEVPSAIKGYVKYFFTCRQCSDNFMKETVNITQLNTNNKHEAIIYLWTIHNHVNQRLHRDITEDPKHPKVQFPSKYLCATCQIINSNEHDISNTLDFLVKYYSKENIDSSSVLQKSQHNEEDLQTKRSYIISKIDSSNETREQFDLFRFFPAPIQRFPFYIFIVFIIIIALFRHQHCKTKGKRMNTQRINILVREYYQ